MLTIQNNISLLPYNTMRIDVQAKYFVEITEESQLLELFESEIFQNNQIVIL